MKTNLSLIFLLLISLKMYSQQVHIIQSTPFENIIKAMKSDSATLFISSFSQNIIGGLEDQDIFHEESIKGLNSAKGKFEELFGDFEFKDFKFEFDPEESRLIIFFKNKEHFRMKVIKEGDAWKIDEI